MPISLRRLDGEREHGRRRDATTRPAGSETEAPEGHNQAGQDRAEVPGSGETRVHRAGGEVKWCGDMTEIPMRASCTWRFWICSPASCWPARRRSIGMRNWSAMPGPPPQISSRRTPLSSLFYRARELGSRRTALSDRVPLVFVPCHAPPQRRCSGATRPPG